MKTAEQNELDKLTSYLITSSFQIETPYSIGEDSAMLVKKKDVRAIIASLTRETERRKAAEILLNLMWEVPEDTQHMRHWSGTYEKTLKIWQRLASEPSEPTEPNKTHK